jgi:hypothetical protein
MYFHEGEHLFVSQGPYPAGKIIAWLLFICFLAYSIFCSTKENIFKTIKTIYPFYWAKQIGIDLYLGIAMTMFVIFLNEGSLLILALWFIPLVLFANLATLLYVAMNYDSIISNFL